MNTGYYPCIWGMLWLICHDSIIWWTQNQVIFDSVYGHQYYLQPATSAPESMTNRSKEFQYDLLLQKTKQDVDLGLMSPTSNKEQTTYLTNYWVQCNGSLPWSTSHPNREIQPSSDWQLQGMPWYPQQPSNYQRKKLSYMYLKCQNWLIEIRSRNQLINRFQRSIRTYGRFSMKKLQMSYPLTMRPIWK